MRGNHEACNSVYCVPGISLIHVRELNRCSWAACLKVAVLLRAFGEEHSVKKIR